MNRVILSLCVATSLIVSGCSDDPSKPEHWEKRISSTKSKKEKVKAVEELRASKIMSDAMIPMLVKRLEAEKAPEVKTSIVRTLGEHYAKAAVDALMNAIDPAPGDTESKTMNKEIAVALGNIGDPKGIPALTKLLKIRDNYTVIAAIEALGAMKASAAFDELNSIASDDTTEPFITKKAINALGNIGDAKAVPTLVKLMLKERKGISFYMEASFSLYQMGTPAADALVPIVDGKDKELLTWAEKNNVKDVAIYAKATQVLGDLHDKRAEKALIGYLNFKSEFDDIRLIMRMRAADALGRIRSKDSVKTLAALLDEPEANARKEYVWALARIGSAEALPKLIETAGKGSWDAREESIRGIAMLSDDPGVFDKLEKAEQKIFEAECKEDPDYRDCKDVGAGVKKHLERMAAYKLRVTAAAECKADAACWVKRLDDKDEGVRERASYQVGRSGNAALIGELMNRLREKNLDTRLAIIQGADWLVHDSKEAMAQAKTDGLAALVKQLAEEKGKNEFIKVNEDLRRLQAKLQRG
jgi:HEAT repeat protein